MSYDSRTRPHQIRPTDDTGALVDPGVYGLEVVDGGPFGKKVDGLTPVVAGLTSDDLSVVITENGDGTLDLAATGGGGGGAYVGCGAERVTNQSIANAGATFTAVQFDADLWDTNSIHDPTTNNSRFTIPAGMGGKWRFEATVRFAANNSGQRALQFFKNGTLLSGRYGGQYINALTGGLLSNFTGGTTLDLAAGDYVEVGVYQVSGSSLNLAEAFAACQFLG